MKVSEDQIREAVMRLSDSIEKAIATAEALMESESEDVRIFALDTFKSLAEMYMGLLEIMGRVREAERHSEERNPLARRA